MSSKHTVAAVVPKHTANGTCAPSIQQHEHPQMYMRRLLVSADDFTVAAIADAASAQGFVLTNKWDDKTNLPILMRLQ